MKIKVIGKKNLEVLEGIIGSIKGSSLALVKLKYI